jgi:hypothetical protein
MEEVVPVTGAALPNIFRHWRSASSEISKHDGSSDGVSSPDAFWDGGGLYVKESNRVVGIQAVATSSAGWREEEKWNYRIMYELPRRRSRSQLWRLLLLLATYQLCVYLQSSGL